MSLLARVSIFARRHDLWRPETRVIAAVSGGSDSVALLQLLADLHARGELRLEAIAHLHHGIRGADADEDQRFCAELARRVGVAFETGRVDVPAEARRRRRSIELTARELRRAFLEQVRRTRGADVVATGHTADDQAETVLLRLVRGTGVHGLGGIAPARAGIVRPLLECTRGELREELTRRGERWREDATNRDRSTPRNRVRLDLLPRLERRFNPAVRRALVRLADLARDDEAALGREAAAAAAHGLRKDESGRVTIEVAAWAALPRAVGRRVLRHAVEAIGGRLPDAAEVAAIEAVLDRSREAAELRGVRVELSGDSAVLTHTGTAPASTPPFLYTLTPPGLVQGPDEEWEVEAASPAPGEGWEAAHQPPETVAVAADGLTSLVVRSRRPGDRMRPLGLSGRKKIQDVLVDRKVPRGLRDAVPIVTDDRGRIIWVAGHVLSEDFRVTDRTKAVLILKLRRVVRLGRQPGGHAGEPRRRGC